ncbi:hypothetical protein E0Z10_g2522 [Xylaria hypoxylon]|uniref:SRR1-like domain-containing protein n=1 Tax=Xylaria hypoxylon TaxID=37992 RepID=A0A4Z0YQG2_9PEZI|nr:hypothetical protein E0Z10_g2522 [Xylaria hypoxylon]
MKPHTTPVDENKLSQMKLIFHEIQTIYDAGTPLFTKDNIREVGKQLQRFQKGERDGGNTILKGVNGIDYEVFIEPRSRDPPRENEHVGGSKWIIIYSSIKHLTTYIDVPFFNLQSAYLPMRIVAPIALLSNRPEYTKPPAPPAPPAEDFGTYQALEREWRTSQHYERLQEMLATIVFPFTLTKVIGLALGALVIRSQVCESTVLQHALVSALHSTLVQRGILSASSKQYVQDPIYTQRDREILHSAGLTVLDDPQALLDLDESSVLFESKTDD